MNSYLLIFFSSDSASLALGYSHVIFYYCGFLKNMFSMIHTFSRNIDSSKSYTFFLSFLHKIAVSEKDTTSYHRKEISEYSSTSFYIGEDITQNDIKAKYENGILSLTIPKFQPRITEKSYIAIE